MDPGRVNSVLTAHSILGIIIDVALIALPVWVVYTTMLSSRKSVQVALVFSVGVFVVITGIVRFVYICVESQQELYAQSFQFSPPLSSLLTRRSNTYSMTTIGIWTDLEAHVGLWCGCFPAMQPILRRLLAPARGVAGVRTRSTTPNGGRSTGETTSGAATRSIP